MTDGRWIERNEGAGAIAEAEDAAGDATDAPARSRRDGDAVLIPGRIDHAYGDAAGHPRFDSDRIELAIAVQRGRPRRHGEEHDEGNERGKDHGEAKLKTMIHSLLSCVNSD